MDPVLGENKPHQYKPVCESHDEYCAICLKDERDPIHNIEQISSFDVAFVEFCNKKAKEYYNKSEKIKTKKPFTYYLDEEISVLRNFWLKIKYTDKSIEVIDLLFSPLRGA